MCEVLKNFICGLIWEVGDEGNVVRNNGDNCVGGIGGFNNVRRRVVGKYDSGSHLNIARKLGFG